MVKSNKAVDSVEFYVNKSMKEFEKKIYGLSGTKLLQFCKDEFGTPLLSDEGKEYSPKSKKYILKSLRELARERYQVEAEDLSQQAKDTMAMESSQVVEEDEPPVVKMEVGSKVYLSRRATSLELESVGTIGVAWMPPMSKNVGRVGVVDTIDSYGCGVRVKFEGQDVMFVYPTATLELYDSEIHDNQTEKPKNVTVIRKATAIEMDASGAAWLPKMDDMVGKVAEVQEATEHVTTIKFGGSETIWQLPTVVLKYTDNLVDEFSIDEEVVPKLDNPQKMTMTTDPEMGCETGPVAIKLSYTTKRNLNEQLFNLTGKMVWCNIFTSHKKMVERVTDALSKGGMKVINIIRIR